MSENQLTLIGDTFRNDKTGERTPGITVIIDGDFKTMLDVILAKEPALQNYGEALRDVIFAGLGCYKEKYEGMRQTHPRSQARSLWAKGSEALSKRGNQWQK